MVAKTPRDHHPIVQHGLPVIDDQRGENAPVVPAVARFVESPTPKARGDCQRDEDGEANVDADEGAPRRRDSRGVGVAAAAAVKHGGGVPPRRRFDSFVQLVVGGSNGVKSRAWLLTWRESWSQGKRSALYEVFLLRGIDGHPWRLPKSLASSS